MNRILMDLHTAARNGDAAAFFTLARSALEAAPRTELEAQRLAAGHGGEDADIRRLLALADEVNYARLRPTGEEFERWMEYIRDALQRDALQHGTLQSGEPASRKLS